MTLPLRLILACLVLVPAAPVAAALAQQPAFVGALVSGSTRYDAEQFSAMYAARLGETLTSRLIDDVIASIEQHYVDDGYFRPRVTIDDRLVRSGVVGFVVTEAAIAAVVIDGDRGPYTAEVDRRLDTLRARKRIDRNAIVTFVRNLRRLPGLDVDAAIRAATNDRRELRLEFDYRAVQSTMQASNRGIEELGRNILFGRVRLNGVLGWSETLDLYGAASTDYARYSGLGIAFGKHLGSNGTRLHASAFVSGAEPEMSIPRVYDRTKMKARLIRPVIDTPRLTLSVAAGLQSRALTVDEDGVQMRDERSSSIALESWIAWRAPDDALYRGEVELRQGLTGLGTRLDPGSSATDRREADFYVVEFDVARIKRFAERWRFEAALAGQMTDSILPSSERFRIGGEDFGRAYDLGEVSGDRGLAGKVELGREVFAGRSISAYEVYGFYDVGAVWPEDYSGRQSAASAGAGLSVRSSRIRAYIEIAEALTRPTEIDGHDPRVFAELQFRF